jgi:NAD(P)-dependent dehydrogenase (short-subunit alcohol dehydrogenase family)
MTLPLAGRTALITGASQGLGLAIAHAYVAAGASVFMCARNGEQLEQARRKVAATVGGPQMVLARAVDVSNRTEVDEMVAQAIRAFERLHIVVNNAGIYGPFGPIEEIDWDEWVQAVTINLFGSVLVARAALPHFKAHRYGKIVQLSGGGATAPMPRISAYAASKAAVVRFAETLAEEVREHHVDVNCIAPGALNTRLLEQVLESGAERVGRTFYDRAVAQKTKGGAPPERGAALAVYLGSAASDGITGKLLSAIWDPWEQLGAHRDDLARTDVYTLRRIVPGERGLDWGSS